MLQKNASFLVKWRVIVAKAEEKTYPGCKYIKESVYNRKRDFVGMKRNQKTVIMMDRLGK